MFAEAQKWQPNNRISFHPEMIEAYTTVEEPASGWRIYCVWRSSERSDFCGIKSRKVRVKPGTVAIVPRRCKITKVTILLTEIYENQQVYLLIMVIIWYIRRTKVRWLLHIYWYIMWEFRDEDPLEHTGFAHLFRTLDVRRVGEYSD